MTENAPARTLVDEYLPVYDVSDGLAVAVDADVSTTWRSLIDADMIEASRRAPVAMALNVLRWLPQLVGDLLHGEGPAKLPERLTLHDSVAIPSSGGGWVLLGEHEEDEIALGLVGKFWRPVIQFAAVGHDDFRDFDEPGFAKTVYSLSVQGLDDGRTLLRGTMRTATTDEHARRWFRRYWTFGVGSGAHVLVQAMLEMVRDDAEATAGHAGRTAVNPNAEVAGAGSR